MGQIKEGMLNCDHFLNHQFKRLLWMLKRTLSMRQYVLDMGASSKYSIFPTFENQILKLTVYPLNNHDSSLNDQLPLERLYKTGKPIIISLIQHFEADFP